MRSPKENTLTTILISGNKTFWRILKPFFKNKDFDSNTNSDFNSIH